MTPQLQLSWPAHTSFSLSAAEKTKTKQKPGRALCHYCNEAHVTTSAATATHTSSTQTSTSLLYLPAAQSHSIQLYWPIPRNPYFATLPSCPNDTSSRMGQKGSVGERCMENLLQKQKCLQLRQCSEKLSFLCSTIHQSPPLFIRHNSNCHYNRILSQHWCHSVSLQMYCFSWSTYFWHISILPWHLCDKGVQTIPLISFLKRNGSRPLYKLLLVY